jgi:glycosyltransferase involved in cell wall biosynthesis
MRGGEKVLEGIFQLFPQADLFTIFHQPGSTSPLIEDRRIVTSFLQPWRNSVGDYRRLLPLFPAAVSRWDFSSYDLVVSSSHCAAKGIRVEPERHLCYCHTPMRYIWDLFDDYFPPRKPLARLAASIVAPPMRRWDQENSSRVGGFIANSHFVARRIRRIYGREAEVVHPFVDDAFLEAGIDGTPRGEYHLMVTALVPYKKVDLAIEAARRAGKRLVVIGSGPMLNDLRRAAPEVEFRGWTDQSDIIRLLAGARSLILPGIEDFGITPLEAMACGTPVVALRDGGVLESVSEGETGIFFDHPSPDLLAAALARVESNQWDRRVLRQRASEFSRERFLARMTAVIDRWRLTR